MSAARGVFITATDTGVGKTALAAATCAALRAQGLKVLAFKPVLSGLDSPGESADHERLSAATGQDPVEVAPLRFGPPVSPHLAAQLDGAPIDVVGLLERARNLAERADVLVVEGVGGLLVPLAEGWDVRAFAQALGYPLVVAARPGLGSINHTLLTLEAGRSAGLELRSVVLTPWPARPSVIEQSNRETIAHLGQIDVSVLPHLDRGIPGGLAEHAAAWLGESSVPWAD